MNIQKVRITGFELGNVHITPSNGYIQDDGIYAIVLINNAISKKVKLITESLTYKLDNSTKNEIMEKLMERWLGKELTIPCNEPFVTRSYYSKAVNVSGNVTKVTESHRLNARFSNKIREMIIGKKRSLKYVYELDKLYSKE